MVHIKPDKRSLRSARLIGDGLLRCLKRKSFDRITITDIQKEAGVGRATFYRLFDNICDVLVYLCDDIFGESFQRELPAGAASPSDVLTRLVRHWMAHSEVLEVIIACNRMDIINNAQRRSAQTLRNSFGAEIDLSEAQMDYLCGVVTSAMAGLLAIWVEHGKTESPEQIAECLYLLPGLLTPSRYSPVI